MVKSALANIGFTMPAGGRREGAGAGAGAGAATGVMVVEYCPYGCCIGTGLVSNEVEWTEAMGWAGGCGSSCQPHFSLSSLKTNAMRHPVSLLIFWKI